MNFLKLHHFRNNVFYCTARALTSFQRNVPTPSGALNPPKTQLDSETILLLERLSLVDCMSKEDIETLEAAIDFADQIAEVNTEGVEPMITVLEDYPLRVREDKVTEGGCKEEVLRNAAVVEDDYFVAPPGNIPLEDRDNVLFEEDDNGNSSETYEFAKRTCSETLPFGIAGIVEDHNVANSKENDFCNLLNEKEMKLLKCTVFQPPNDSTQFFHQWQRQRRMWWRKFSADPGKYALTDIKNVDENNLSVEICAEYPWGKQTIETIILDHLDKQYTTPQLQFKQGRVQVQAHTITSTIVLPVMFLNAVCDVYDESKLHDKIRTMLRFHRKLAPYQIGLSLTASNAAGVSELKDLAEYLTRLLRTSHVSTFYVPNSYKNPLESQYKWHDQLGVPYTVVLNEKTLVNGLCHLRSRDTTLKEQVHVANLVSYVEQLFKNY